jgi:hypothetical protein
MNLTLQARIDLMVQLGDYLSSGSSELDAVKVNASQKNSWFIPRFIDFALSGIAGQYLQRSKLEAWMRKYSLPAARVPKNVGIVMAGNIPAVGFHDFLCTFLAGQDMTLKLSSKDEVLISHLVEKLKSWEPALKKHIQIKDMLKGCDAYIATGSNNSARYFQYYFRRYPHIIRYNRTSVAWLEGDESREELERLSDDVFLYFGLGCRNVTKLYVPEGYDFIPLLEAFKRYSFLKDFHHYSNNFDYNLSLALLNKSPYMTNEMVLLLDRESVFSPIGVLHYERYEQGKEIKDFLHDDDNIQCIVGRRYLPFGSSQKPSLDDYADGVDTMRFLNSL